MHPMTALVLLSNTVTAAPAQFTHQGRLLDADERPIEGETALTFRVLSDDIGGDILWEETLTVTLTHGFYSAVLGADIDDNPLDTDVLSQAPVWLELQVEGEEAMVPRSPINSVPYAAMATVAEEVAGGPVDATQVAIDGEVVINDAGEWVGTPATVSWSDIADMPADFADGIDDDSDTDTDTDSLADLALSCEDGDIPVWDAVVGAWACDIDQDSLAFIGCTEGQLIRWSADSLAWVCGDDIDTTLTASDVDIIVADYGYAMTADVFSGSFSDLTGVPADLLDGDDDTTLSESEVDAMVDDNGYAMATDVFSGAFSDLSGIPGGLLDGDDDSTLSESEVDAMVGDNGYAMATDVFSGSFSDLSDVPDGLGVDSDTLGSLDCETGQFIIKTESGWDCTDPYSALDADGDGTFAWIDCDDSDPSSTIKASDADCDGVLTEDDCDDADATIAGEVGSEDCPARSCASINDDSPDRTSGYYWVDPDGDVGLDAFEVYCDLEDNDGGWTLVAVISGTSGGHVNRSAVGTIGYPDDLSLAKLSDNQINLLSNWDGTPSDSAYRFTCNGVTDFLRYEVGWNSESHNDDADFTYRYVCSGYSPCVNDGSWSYYDGGTSGSDRGGGSYPQGDALQYQADGNSGCYHGGYYRDGLLWVR